MAGRVVHLDGQAKAGLTGVAQRGHGPCEQRPAHSCTLLGRRWHIKSRHKAGEITLDNLWYPQQWLFRHEWLVQRRTNLDEKNH